MAADAGGALEKQPLVLTPSKDGAARPVAADDAWPVPADAGDGAVGPVAGEDAGGPAGVEAS